MNKKYVILSILLLLVLSLEAQCAMCRAVLESEEGMETAKSVNSGIKYLMIFPYILVGGLAYYIYRKYRN